MSSFIFIVAAFCLCFATAFAAYSLVDEYHGNSFFDGFNLVNWNGASTFSNFVMNYDQAQQMGLINTTSSRVYIGTDYWNKVSASGDGRPAIEIVSKKSYSVGLFITDLSHMPYGCGVWPAYWLNGPNWPNNGEIDIVEQINLNTDDQTTLHTNLNCFYDSAVKKQAQQQMTGVWPDWQSGNCSYQPGCSIEANNKDTFGHQFNANGGGVFATVVDDAVGIKSWFWTHAKVPADVKDKKPDPNSWGKAFAFWPFGSWCTSGHFKDLQIIFDLYYCGWSGTDKTWKSQCQDTNIANGKNCEAFVANTPAYFANAYWIINDISVYQQ